MSWKRWAMAFYAALGAAVALDLAFYSAGLLHSHLAIENLPGFGAVAGFASAMAIAWLAKGLGKLFLLKGEDYYD